MRLCRTRKTEAGTGLVLLGPDELTSIPGNAGFANQRQKDAFGAGRFRLTGALPRQVLHGRIRWADGATRAVPLLGAQAAFQQLAANRACALPQCGGQLTITSPGPLPATGRDVPGAGGLLAVSADGRTLTLQFTTGACVTAWGGRLYQTSTAVVVGSWSGGGSGQMCPADAVFRSAKVTLARPLGSRVVLDVATGEPLVLGGPMYL